MELSFEHWQAGLRNSNNACLDNLNNAELDVKDLQVLNFDRHNRKAEINK